MHSISFYVCMILHDDDDDDSPERVMGRNVTLDLGVTCAFWPSNGRRVSLDRRSSGHSLTFKSLC